MKRRLKGALIGALLSTACIPALFSGIHSYAADGVSFAGGNNSYTSGDHSNSNVAGWGITFNTSGGNGESRVIGAKISVYYTTDENIIVGADTLTKQQRRCKKSETKSPSESKKWFPQTFFKFKS